MKKYFLLTLVISVLLGIVLPLALGVVSGQEKSKIDNAVGYIHNVQNRVINSEMDIERNIDDLLKAIDSILTVTSVDISAIRLMMDYLLKTWEGRWYF